MNRPRIENRLISSIPIHEETEEFIRCTLDFDMKQAVEVTMSPLVKQELNRVLPAYLEEKLELRVPSRGFLNLIP